MNSLNVELNEKDTTSIIEEELNEEELCNILDTIMIDDIKKIENKSKEIIKFFYFSELNLVNS